MWFKTIIVSGKNSKLDGNKFKNNVSIEKD